MHAFLARVAIMATGSQSNFRESLGKLKVSIRCVVKGYQNCLFKVEKGEMLLPSRKLEITGAHSKLLTPSKVNLDISNERLFQCSGH